CYGRVECRVLVELIIQVYREIWGPLHNFFLPSMKLIHKERIGARWRRIHDQPQTAYQRLLKMGVLNSRKKRQLKAQYQSLDPFELHERLDKSLRPILARALEATKDLNQPPGGGK